MEFNLTGGFMRRWYAGYDGVRRWVHNDELVEAMPPITPPNGLEVTEYRDTALLPNNTDIQVSESAYYPADLVVEGDECEARR